MVSYQVLVMRVLIAIYLVFSPFLAADELEGRWLSVVLENDFIADDDAGYSNGIIVAWGHYATSGTASLPAPSWVQNMAEKLPFMNEESHYSYSQAVAQGMFTPEDLEQTTLIENDRPYAGLLLWRQRLNSFDSRKAYRYSLNLGVVGPVSGAEQLQLVIHRLRGVGSPNGWEHQLNNEIVASASLELLRRAVLFESAGLSVDTVGYGGLEAGNLRSEAGLGFSFRVGSDLHKSFASTSLMPGRNEQLFAVQGIEWYVFVNVYATHLFNDILLDGNTFRSSHSVTLINNQVHGATGMSIQYNRWGALLSLQDSSQNFEEKKENRLFLQLSVAYRW